jgi:hypothetical protein
MLARSVDRGVNRTDPVVTARIQRQMEMSVCYHRAYPERIPERLRELDEEWDVERALEAASSTLSLMGFTWGLFRKRWWLIGLAAQSFFLQHALQGWAPPVEMVRRLGFRTAHEIETERHELLAIASEGDRGRQTGATGRKATEPSATEPAFQPA